MIFQKLYYLSPRDMRKNRADAVHIMYSCAAFVNNGLKVTLLTPRVLRDEYKIEKEKIFSLYNVPDNFKITELTPAIKEKKNNIGNPINTAIKKFYSHFMFAINNYKSLKSSDIIVYSKCYISTVPYILLKSLKIIKPVLVFETPLLKDNFYHKFIIRNVDFINSSHLDYMCQFLTKNFEIDKAKIINKTVMRFQTDYNKTLDAKESGTNKIIPGIKDKRKQIVYAGKTGPNSKRLNYFLGIAKKLPDYNFKIVGANNSAFSYLKSKEISNLEVIPFVPFKEYLNHVETADILIANYEDNFYNRNVLGPSKAGAYLSSGNPVIFSDLPSLREFFSEEILYYAKPEDIDDWVNKIKEILDNPHEAQKKAVKAKEFVEERTFTKAAKEIIEEIENSLSES